MAGLVPAIHAFGLARLKDVDTRDKRGHDGQGCMMGPVEGINRRGGEAQRWKRFLSRLRRFGLSAITALLNFGFDPTRKLQKSGDNPIAKVHGMFHKEVAKRLIAPPKIGVRKVHCMNEIYSI